MSSHCPSGHESVADDYCDVCGLPITAPSEEPVATDASASAQEESQEFFVPNSTCPNCGADSPLNALFCEACGYDFTTGAAPRPAASVLDLPPEPEAATPTATPSDASTDAGWVLEIWIDPDWYAEQSSDEPLPSAGLPTVVPLTARSVLIGRPSRSRGIDPEIDLSSDHGISRRHCQLTTDGRRWWVEDLDSSNGTFLGASVGAVPDQPLPPGRKHEIGPDDRIYLGAWTRLHLRKAAPGEA